MSEFEAINELCMSNVEWLGRQLGYAIASVSFEDMSGAGGLNAQMRRMRIVTAVGNEEKTYVLKNVRPTDEGLVRSKQLGLPREALFFRELASEFSDIIPSVLFSFGDMESGEKYILLQDMSNAVQSGYFFGPVSPHNWGRDLPAQMDRAPQLLLAAAASASASTSTASAAASSDSTSGSQPIPSASNFEAMRIIAQSSYMLAARMHGSNWCKHSLLDKSWLRGSDWLRGEGEETWRGSQDMAKNFWTKLKGTKMNSEGYAVKWSSFMMELMDSSFAKIDWEHFQKRIKQEPWSLVHGDFHPANMMWSPSKTTANTAAAASGYSVKQQAADRATSENPAHPIHQLRSSGVGIGSNAVSSGDAGSLFLLDWENVGLGSGPQDLGQYVISHMAAVDRRACEMELLQLYYQELLSHIKAAAAGTTPVAEAVYSWDDCLAAYVHGGVERWVWLLALLGMMCPDPMVQFFHDQVEAFAADHGITADTIGMPRL